MTAINKQITVLGIGNILLKDEGFGVRVVEELLGRYRFPAAVQVLDGGTLGMDLLRFLTGTKRLVVVDAIDGGGPPGTFYRFAGDEVKAYFREKVSLHELGIKDVLAVLEATGRAIEEVVVLGVQPESLDLGLELTPVAAAVLPDTVAAVLAELDRWQVEVTAIDG
ncbi:HyaD/HybD family hydrogenase maturation endopeptidase [Anaeroselena agilis]|uniref:HyaD/HybD family hydrogenase maturation endopeptidase n=1 Tax=Anaeroselena agilis TaxID=3063788 RepID=A0ABU3NYP0_9FIRM|nr:HyaD/HybD family hydrogenase maturation endopeptidase [Selenomonadales bacterium 4137-cl]